MANYKQVSYGSRGGDVTELQKRLNQNGYKLDEDGIFGNKTQAAVRDYQQKNNLVVDGIVGDKTWGSLTGFKPTETADTMGTSVGNAQTTSSAKTQNFDYGEYKPSDAVTQVQAMLDQQLSQKPGAYQSGWQAQLNDTINAILNREKFSYNLNGDALYQQYKNQYTQQGRMAMMDTMGQAQAMTGGYGNSYAQSVGQQAYQGYLQQLNDQIPELYQLAMSKYQMEGDDLNARLAMLSQREERDYGRYRDQVGDWQSERDFLTGRYDAERDYDYGKWADQRDFDYGQHRDSVADGQWQQSFEYQQERDKTADEQWQAEFDEAKRQYDQDYALSASRSYGGGSGSNSGGGTDKNTDNKAETVNPYEGADVEAMIRGAGSEAEVQAMIDDLLKYGYDRDALMELYEELYGNKNKNSGGGGNTAGPGYPGLKNQISQTARY